MGIVGMMVLFFLEIQASFFFMRRQFGIDRFLGIFFFNFNLKRVIKNVQVVSLSTYFSEVVLLKGCKKCLHVCQWLKLHFYLIWVFKDGYTVKNGPGQLQNTLLLYFSVLFNQPKMRKKKGNRRIKTDVFVFL